MPRRSPLERARLWGPPVAYMGLIFFLSSESNPVPEVTALVWDKVLHGVEYSILGVLLSRALTGEGLASTSSFVLALIAASAYGASDEWHQAFVPLRSADLSDWTADTVGSLVGGVTYAASCAARLGRRLGGAASAPIPPRRL